MERTPEDYRFRAYFWRTLMLSEAALWGGVAAGFAVGWLR